MFAKKASLLDCTLRDGGYINDWEFGHSVITGTYKKLDASGVDYIEVGFLDDRRPFDINRTITPNTEGFNRIFKNVQKKQAIPVAMIDFGTCSLENIGTCDSTFIDGIRVIFKKEKIEQALPFCKAIKDKGYKLFIQAISITAYSDMDMLQYIEKINEIKPDVFSIVDTYGLLDKKRMAHYYDLIDTNLDSDIVLGYHAHNNFQLAFSNSIDFLAQNSNRELVVDATVYGMGKSAGNCPIELLSMHLNQYYGKQYDINQFLEVLDADLMPVYQKQYWGYKYNFYISALQNCHPNYVQYLLDKKTLAISAVNEILATIPEEKKLHYDKQFIEESYIQYQSTIIDDELSVSCLQEELKGKKILLLGPGKSIREYQDVISKFIKDEAAIIISTNFVSDMYDCHYVFVSNAKRYSKLMDTYSQQNSDSKIMITSNVIPFDRPADITLNYRSLMQIGGIKSDNALLLCLSAMMRAGVDKVTLAGFDGFSTGENYFDSSLSYAGNESYSIHNNELIMLELEKLSSEIDIEFLTPSLYESKK